MQTKTNVFSRKIENDIALPSLAVVVTNLMAIPKMC